MRGLEAGPLLPGRYLFTDFKGHCYWWLMVELLYLITFSTIASTTLSVHACQGQTIGAPAARGRWMTLDDVG